MAPVKHEVAVGQRFGRWTVVETGHTTNSPIAKRGRRAVLAVCDCGTGPKRVGVYPLVSGSSASCGCTREEHWARVRTETDLRRLKRAAQREDYRGPADVGVRYGTLTVVETGFRMPVTPSAARKGAHAGHIAVRVQCDCGSPTYIASVKNLREGGVKSCGCRSGGLQYLVRAYGQHWRPLHKKGADLCRCAWDDPMPAWVVVVRAELPEVSFLWQWDIECRCGRAWDLEIFDRMSGESFTAEVFPREPPAKQYAQLAGGRRA